MADLMETLTTANVVASTSIDQELHLEQLTADLDGGQYHPAHFPGLIIYRLTDQGATVLMFRTGKLVCTGAPSELAATNALQVIGDELRTVGIAVPNDFESTIQNMVWTGNLETPLTLNALAVGFGFEQVEYKPEQFTGLVYHLDDPAVVVLLFANGKLMITGGARPADAERAIRCVHAEIEALGLL